MVQYFRGGPSRSTLWAQMLGPSLGEGLGSFLGNYQVNKSLDQLVNNPEYKNKTQAERMEALQSTLGRYGERGQKALQTRLGIEQQSLQDARNKAENKFLSGGELTEREQELVRPELRVSAAKANKPAGGVSAQPVPVEIGSKINQVLNENKEATADELLQKMDDAGIPRTYSNSYAENRRREQERISGETIKIHEMSKDEDAEIREKAAVAKKQLEAVKDIRSTVNKVKPGQISNWFKGFGKVGDKLADAFTTAEQGKFSAALPALIEGWKDVFGVRLSDADLKIIQDKLPGLGKDPEANKAILDVIEKYAKPHIYRQEIANEIKKENKGFRPINFNEQIEERLGERLKTVEMVTPNGKLIKVPKDEVEDAKKLGATIRGEK